jgi:phosphomannomutase
MTAATGSGQPGKAPVPGALRARVAAWIAEDPDPADRAELAALLAEDEPAAQAELADRFAGRLVFGTAGLRGAVAAGPNRMNRAVVRATTAALAAWLTRRVPGAARAGVVIGCDARHRSADFAEEAARVLAGAGIAVRMLPPRQPTPLLAFAVRHLATAAGIMITASHNPPADNGYKLYLADGAQVIPPADAEIEAEAAALPPLSRIPVAASGDPLITRLGGEVAEAYLAAVTAAGPPAAAGEPPPVVYTPLHGVAADLALRAFARAGYPAPHVVAAQAAPDPDFPTVAFPNPEEPGVLDLALAEARRLGAGLVIAHDPDGDRLAVAVPDPAVPGRWQRLTGDQVGALLGAWLLERTSADPDPASRLVVTTVVSSSLLSKIAAAAGARYAETLTGFKWIARAADHNPGSRFLFGYEEALGYAVSDTVRDKDGISAALAVLALAAQARAAGQTLLDRWDILEAAHGVHLTAPVTLRTRSPAQVMASLRATPPATLAGQPVTAITDLAGGQETGGQGEARQSAREQGTGGQATGLCRLPPADLLIYRLPGARVVLRPSGTEPKLKAYLEVTEPPGPSLAAARAAASARLGPLRAAVMALVSGK